MWKTVEKPKIYIKKERISSRAKLTGETLLSETDPKFTKILRNLINSGTVPLKIVNLLIFIDHRLEIGKTA